MNPIPDDRLTWRDDWYGGFRNRSSVAESTQTTHTDTRGINITCRMPAASGHLEPEQPRCVETVDAGAFFVADRQLRDRVEHRRDAADLMRIVAAGEDVIGAGELDRQLQRALVEVHGVVVELAQVAARLAIDVGAAILERVEAAIEPLGEVRNRAAEMTERPADAWIALGDAAEHQ